MPENPLARNANKKRISTSELYLIIVNLIPIAGVGLLGWSLFDILLVYWMENAVIGFFNVLKIIKAQGGQFRTNDFETPLPAMGIVPRIFFIIFFIIHFGGFMLGHGVFIFVLFSPKGLFPSGSMDMYSLALTFLLFVVSHGISYWQNYIGNEEFRRISPVEAMFLPYRRIVVMHLTVMCGAFVFAFFKLNNLAGVLVVVIKTVLDFSSHQRQHAPAWLQLED